MATIYIAGIVEWPTLNNTDFLWLLLLDTYTPDPTAERYIADVAADEPTDGSYARVTLTGATQTIDLPGLDVTYDAGDPTFPLLAGAETVGWLVLAKLVTVDADSPLLAAYPLTYVTSGVNFTPRISGDGLVVFGQCPGG